MMQKNNETNCNEGILCLGDITLTSIKNLLQGYKLDLILSSKGAEIPGSYWGESEAGLIANKVYARLDTPIHSILHETCHAICMTPERRAGLDTDAGGDYAEEDAVCYLQILFADAIPEMGRVRMMRDMDTWGYSFRLGSAQKWFEQDADDARLWLLSFEIISAEGLPTGKLRAI
jgi:hypothetical protein